jgi:hypothetical protein
MGCLVESASQEGAGVSARGRRRKQRSRYAKTFEVSNEYDGRGFLVMELPVDGTDRLGGEYLPCGDVEVVSLRREVREEVAVGWVTVMLLSLDVDQFPEGPLGTVLVDVWPGVMVGGDPDADWVLPEVKEEVRFSGAVVELGRSRVVGAFGVDAVLRANVIGDVVEVGSNRRLVLCAAFELHGCSLVKLAVEGTVWERAEEELARLSS